jgi:tetratricopeptide (TPR) repeat protein
MKAFMLAASAAMLVGIAPAHASVLTMGNSYAESCYRSAEARITSLSALDACDHALASEALMIPDRVGTLVNRGILRMISGKLDAANRDFDDALALDASEPEAWLNKAIAQMNGGNSQAALELVNKAIALNPGKPHIAYFVRGLAHEDTGNLKAAYADLQRARELAPKWSEPVVELARYQVKSR